MLLILLVVFAAAEVIAAFRCLCRVYPEKDRVATSPDLRRFFEIGLHVHGVHAFCIIVFRLL